MVPIAQEDFTRSAVDSTTGTSSRNTRTDSNEYPFDCIIITFPDEASATFASNGPIQQYKERFAASHNEICIIATCDPYSCRVGSGGGTLAALSYYIEQQQSPQQQQPDMYTKQNIVIIHAGGESSRCPTQMCLGKSWTSIPCYSSSTYSASDQYKYDTTSTTSSSNENKDTLQTPLDIWIFTLCPKLFQRKQDNIKSSSYFTLPTGSVVVIAADTILAIPEYVMNATDTDADTNTTASDIDIDTDAVGVIALAVPAPLSTAKNHGVFIVTESASQSTGNVTVPSTFNDDNSSTCTSTIDLSSNCTNPCPIHKCSTILQKPTIDTLLQNTNYHFLLKNETCRNQFYDNTDQQEEEEQQQQQKYSWIDTGVTIFLPNVVQIFYQWITTSTTESIVQSCTASGLRNMYHREYPNTTSTGTNNNDEAIAEQDIQFRTFCQKNTLKIDLYTNILQAFQLEGNICINDNITTSDHNNKESDKTISFQRYLQQQGTSISESIATFLFKSLNQYPLRVACLQNGRFLHIGTTLELQEFLQYGSMDIIQQSTLATTTAVSRQLTFRQNLCRQIGIDLQLMRRLKAVTVLNTSTSNSIDFEFGNVGVHPTSTIYHSVIIASSSSEYGNSSSSLADVKVTKTAASTTTTSIPKVEQHHQPLRHSYIGYNTIVEHCYWYGQCIQIGANCLISGLRSSQQLCTNINISSFYRKRLCIPDNMIVQMIPLQKERLQQHLLLFSSSSTSSSSQSLLTILDKFRNVTPYVLIVLGMKDDIKSNQIMYNTQLATLLSSTLIGISQSDLWELNPDGDRTATTMNVWNATMHPVILMNNDLSEATISALEDETTAFYHYSDLFDWLFSIQNFTLKDNEQLYKSSSLLQWKQSARLSLCQIRSLADSMSEFTYRYNLVEQFIPFSIQQQSLSIKSILTNRTHAYIDVQYVIDDYAAKWIVSESKQIYCGHNHVGSTSIIITKISCDQLLSLLHNTFDSALQLGHDSQIEFDIYGRSCMVTSGLFSEIASSLKYELVKTNIHDDSTAPAVRNDIMDRLCKIGTASINILRSQCNHFCEFGSINTSKYSSLYDCYNIEVVQPRDELIQQPMNRTEKILVFEKLSETMEVIARLMTEAFVCIWNTESLPIDDGQVNSMLSPVLHPVYDQWVVATAPARIDLAGGWTDTPPICYELGSAVIGVAVAIDGMHPLAARCRIVRGKKGILLKSEMRDFVTGRVLTECQSEIDSVSDFDSCRDPSTNNALLKCVLVRLGLLSLSSNNEEPLQQKINQFCCRNSDDVNFRLELISTSLLPQGSGLGTSSVLAGCFVAAVARCVGILDDSKGTRQENFLVNEVLKVEQLLTTGGGYQDQVNGIIGGVKFSQTKPITASSIEASPTEGKIEIERIQLDLNRSDIIGESFVLVFTGQTRLAKNLLVNVLRRWSKRTPEICQATTKLVACANSCYRCVNESDLNGIGNCLSEYWTLKKIMAGPNSGVEPQSVRTIIDILHNKLMVTRGASLCGAGGGGFLVLMVKDGYRSKTLKEMFENYINTNRVSTSIDSEAQFNTNELTWYDTSICDRGLSIRLLNDDAIETNDTTYFDLSWLRVAS